LSRFLYDTAIFVYALGGEHRYRAPCRAIVERAAAQELRGEASADLVQELAFYRLRRTGDRRIAVEDARHAASLCELHEVSSEDALRGLELFAEVPQLSPRDAVFASVALNRGIPFILSTDRAFDHVPELTRIDPGDERAVDRLCRPPAQRPGR
jgi:predicted nucleic acid-binding protein